MPFTIEKYRDKEIQTITSNRCEKELYLTLIKTLRTQISDYISLTEGTFIPAEETVFTATFYIERTLHLLQTYLPDILENNLSITKDIREQVLVALKPVLQETIHHTIHRSLVHDINRELICSSISEREHMMNNRRSSTFYPHLLDRERIPVPTRKGEEICYSGHHDLYKQVGGGLIKSDLKAGAHSRLHTHTNPNMSDRNDMRTIIESQSVAEHDPSLVKAYIQEQQTIGNHVVEKTLTLPPSYDRVTTNLVTASVLHLIAYTERALGYERQHNPTFLKVLINHCPERLFQPTTSSIPPVTPVETIDNTLTPTIQHYLLKNKVDTCLYKLEEYTSRLQKNIQMQDTLRRHIIKASLGTPPVYREDPLQVLGCLQKEFSRHRINAVELKQQIDTLSHMLKYLTTQNHTNPREANDIKDWHIDLQEKSHQLSIVVA